MRKETPSWSRLAEMLLASTRGGMSYRKVARWAREHLGMVIPPAWCKPS
ncbi:MAG: hypothetical protein ABSA70_10380 [Terriglobia bacterium]